MLRSTWLRHISSSSLRGNWPREICRREYSLQTDQDFSPTPRSRHSSIKWRHLHPEGRVVGSGRRRQRVVSADLVRKSLDQPARVVLLQDFHDERHGRPEGASLTGHDVQQPQQMLSAQEIERAITSRHMTPDEAEISASIQTLRPDSIVLDQESFEKVRLQLVSAYTLPQLSSYLVAVLSPSSAQAPPLTGLKHTKVMKLSTWQPGRTALDARPAKLVKSTTLSRKSRTADRILRLAWRVTVYSEEREMGELELTLQPWQMSMLFDLSCEGEFYYKRFLSPPFLVEATEVLAWRPDNIVRVAGRRRDAEEVAYQLEVALSSVHRSEMDLARFATGTTASTQAKDICTKRELDLISKVTQSVVVAEQRSTVTVYNITAAGTNRARRLLLSLINPSSTSVSTDATLRKRVSGEHSAYCLLPADATDLGLHIRERRRDSKRQVARQPTRSGARSANQVTTSQQRHGAASTIVGHLQSLDITHQPNCPISSDGYWNTITAPSEWQADVVRLLQPGSGIRSTLRTGEPPIETAVQRHLPGIEIALSIFNVHKNAREGCCGHSVNDMSAMERLGPRLVAYLVPSARFDEHCRPPRVEMHFSFSASPEPELRLIEMKAVLDEQRVECPLQSNSVDLLFTRRQGMAAKVELLRADSHIAAFTQALQESVRATGSTISAPPEVVIHLPASLVGAQSTTSDLPTIYLLERLEQTQARTFSLDRTSPSGRSSGLARDKADDLRLEYKEIEGDSVRGSSSILTIKIDEQIQREAETASDDATPGSAESPAGDHRLEAAPLSAPRVYQTTLAALYVAEVLTDAADGSLKAWKATQ